MATQMQLAREGKVTDAMRHVAEEEQVAVETVRERVAKGMTESVGGDGTVKKQPRKVAKIGRNDPCPCGSGKKYKQCCGR